MEMFDIMKLVNGESKIVGYSIDDAHVNSRIMGCVTEIICMLTA